MTIEQENLMLQNEVKAIESEIFMAELFDDDTTNIAIEGASEIGAKLKDAIIKAADTVKKIFLFLPKLFAKAVRRIRNSIAISKMRTNSSIPEDLKEINNDKLKQIKRCRLEILELKQECMNLGDSEINKAISISDQLNKELGMVVKNLRTRAGVKNTVKNNIGYNEGKVRNLREKITTLKSNIKSTEALRNLKKKIDDMHQICGDTRLSALCIPAYKGTCKAETYKNIIENNCNQYTSSIAQLEEMVNKYSKKGITATGKEVHSARSDDNVAMMLAKLYLESGDFLKSVANNYVNVCNEVFRVYQIPDDGNHKTSMNSKDVEDNKPTSDGKKTVKNPSGKLTWSDSEKHWVYTRSFTNAEGKLKYINVNLNSETNKDSKPEITVEMEKTLNDKLKVEQKKHI